jgi:restriction endonuclease S subunit
MNSRFLYFFCLGYNFKLHDSGVTIPSLTKTELLTIKIPLPTLDVQNAIVKVIEDELQLVSANKQLITIFEQKIKDKINEVWAVKEEVYA